ncbi:MAG: thymidine kinase [Francisellaceae bacterium]|jgi:thymidine kinase
MAKLYFYYSTMNAGKSTALLQSAYNYEERGMSTLLFAPKLDDRYEQGKITSRIGLSSDALLYEKETNLEDLVKEQIDEKQIHCVFVDEAQFLTKKQVYQLSNIVDKYNIPVLAYGLRNDFQSEPFEGSKYLLTWSDELIEIKTICHCGRKANHVYRTHNEEVVTSGNQIQIGGNDQYVSVCRKHYKSAIAKYNY